VNDDSVKYGKKIIKLPRRLVAFDFFDSLRTRPYAAAASFVQSCGYLRSKNIFLTDHLEFKLKPALETFASDMNVQHDELFGDEIWKENDLQRRGAELSQEKDWLDIKSSANLPATIKSASSRTRVSCASPSTQPTLYPMKKFAMVYRRVFSATFQKPCPQPVNVPIATTVPILPLITFPAVEVVNSALLATQLSTTVSRNT
jgi:hypothetical protein